MFVQATLTSPDVDFGTNGYLPLEMESKQQVLEAYNAMADKLIAALKNTSDETFEQICELLWEGDVIFSGTRYNAYSEPGAEPPCASPCAAWGVLATAGRAGSGYVVRAFGR